VSPDIVFHAFGFGLPQVDSSACGGVNLGLRLVVPPAPSDPKLPLAPLAGRGPG
jgi:hypothetical protein